MSCDQALDKLSEKLHSRLLLQEKHGFQKGAQCAPLATGDQKKLGPDRVKWTRENKKTKGKNILCRETKGISVRGKELRRLVKDETDWAEDIATGKEFQRIQVDGRKEER